MLTPLQFIVKGTSTSTIMSTLSLTQGSHEYFCTWQSIKGAGESGEFLWLLLYLGRYFIGSFQKQLSFVSIYTLLHNLLAAAIFKKIFNLKRHP